jgi:NMD protein affecting ribosome stability and mRNA decay
MTGAALFLCERCGKPTDGIVADVGGQQHLCPDCALVVLTIGAWFSK